MIIYRIAMYFREKNLFPSGVLGSIIGIACLIFFVGIPLITGIMYFPIFCLEIANNPLLYVLFLVCAIINIKLMRSEAFAERQWLILILEEIAFILVSVIGLYLEKTSTNGFAIEIMLLMSAFFASAIFSIICVLLNCLISYGASKIKFTKNNT